MTNIIGNNNVCDQTTAEWIDDYNNHNGIEKTDDNNASVSSIKQNLYAKPLSELFRYVEHRTTCRGSVVLVFISLDGKHEVIKYFNINQQGRDKKYPAKRGGQFNPPRGGKMRKFWMACVGKEPSRWCRVHKSLKSALSDLVFTGEIVKATDRKGEEYNKFTEVRVYEENTK